MQLQRSSCGFQNSSSSDPQLAARRTSCGRKRSSCVCIIFGRYCTSGTNWQVVSAWFSSVNICSLQMEHSSAAFFFIGAIGSNGSIGTIGSKGTNRQVVYARPSGVNICSLQIVYQSTNYFSNGIDSKQWHQSTNCLRTALKLSSNEMQLTKGIPMDWGAFHSWNGANRKASLMNGDFLPVVPLVRVSWQLVSVCVYWTCVNLEIKIKILFDWLCCRTIIPKRSWQCTKTEKNTVTTIRWMLAPASLRDYQCWLFPFLQELLSLRKN